MADQTPQITVRGLDAQTKAALVKRAHQEGLSLNRYALKALQQVAGTDQAESRYQAFHLFLTKHHLDSSDKSAFDSAIRWSDTSAAKKQTREDHDIST